MANVNKLRRSPLTDPSARHQARRPAAFPEAEVGARVITQDALRGIICSRNLKKGEWMIGHTIDGIDVERRYGLGEFSVLGWQIMLADENGLLRPVRGLCASEEEALGKLAVFQAQFPGNTYKLREEVMTPGGPLAEKRKKGRSRRLPGTQTGTVCV